MKQLPLNAYTKDPFTSYTAITAKGIVLTVKGFHEKSQSYIAEPQVKPEKRTFRNFFRRRDTSIWYRPDGTEVNKDESLRIVGIVSLVGRLNCLSGVAYDHIDKGGSAWTYKKPSEQFYMKLTFQKE